MSVSTTYEKESFMAPLPEWAFERNMRNFATVDMRMVELVGWEAAGLLSRIHFRSQGIGYWVATREEMMADTCLTTRKLKTALGVVRDQYGWVLTERDSAYNPTLRYSLDYGDDSTDPEGTKRLSAEGTKRTAYEGTKRTALSTIEVIKKKDNPALSCSDDFDKFWKLYPRKTGKAEAVKSFTKATKTADPEVIVAGLTAQLPSLMASELKYRPHASTWLNRRRWEDELETVAGEAPIRINHSTGLPMGWGTEW